MVVHKAETHLLAHSLRPARPTFFTPISSLRHFITITGSPATRWLHTLFNLLCIYFTRAHILTGRGYECVCCRRTKNPGRRFSSKRRHTAILALHLPLLLFRVRGRAQLIHLAPSADAFFRTRTHTFFCYCFSFCPSISSPTSDDLGVKGLTTADTRRISSSRDATNGGAPARRAASPPEILLRTQIHFLLEHARFFCDRGWKIASSTRPAAISTSDLL